MAVYIPTLHPDGYEVSFGDKENSGNDYIVKSFYTFIRLPYSMTPDKLALYFKRLENQAFQTRLTCNITIAEIRNWADPDEGNNPVLVASNVNLSNILSGEEGWKWINIEPFIFLANKTYVVRFDVVSINRIDNQLSDDFYCAGAERISLPYEPGMPPPEFPEEMWESLVQTISKYVRNIEDNPDWGHAYRFPLAVALSDEELPEPATIIIDTTPVKGNIFLDGASQGVAPVTLSVDPGTYTISFGDVGGYTKPNSQTIVVAAGETHMFLGEYIEIIPEKATIIIDTTPVKGNIFLDGASQGVAPVTLSVDPGTYTISFGDVGGYTKPNSQTIVVAAEETKNITGDYIEIEEPEEKPILIYIISAGVLIGVGYLLLKK